MNTKKATLQKGEGLMNSGQEPQTVFSLPQSGQLFLPLTLSDVLRDFGSWRRSSYNMWWSA
jgi:hypothetical protein